MLNYKEFILESTPQYPIYYSFELREMIISISESIDKHNDIPLLLLSADNDINNLSKFTLIDITDKNNYLSFVQSNRISRKYSNIKPGSLLPFKIFYKGNDDDLWTSGRSNMTVGKTVRKILKDVLGKQVNNNDLEEFVNQYKALYDENKSIDLEIVEGEEIRKCYLVDNYFNKKGQLGSSCMRHTWNQSYFDIYVENPEVCKLVILKSDNKIKGRALLWKLKDGGYYLDRPYTNNDSDILLLEKWASDKGYKYFSENFRNEMYVILKIKGEYKKYPYMDTFRYYNTDKGILTNDENYKDNDIDNFITLNSTTGGFSGGRTVICDFTGEELEMDEVVETIDGGYVNLNHAIYIDSNNSYYSPEDSRITYCNYYDSYQLLENTIFSSYLQDNILKEDALEVYTKDKKIDIINKQNLEKVFKFEKDYYISEYWYINPFENNLLPKNKKTNKKILKDIYNHFNLSGDLYFSYNQDTLISKSIKIYKEEKEKYSEVISKDPEYINSIKNVYWGINDQEYKPTPDFILGIMISSISGRYNNLSQHDINILSSLFETKKERDKWNYYNKENLKLLFFIKHRYIPSFDYYKFGGDLYKIYLYFNLKK